MPPLTPEVVQAWLDRYNAPAMLEVNAAIATGETRYADGRVFSNLFQLEFDDEGRCSRFVEWFMSHPEA